MISFGHKRMFYEKLANWNRIIFMIQNLKEISFEYFVWTNASIDQPNMISEHGNTEICIKFF